MATTGMIRRGRTGHLKVVTGTDPADNVEISETVPAGKTWRIHTIDFTFVTDANAANRRVHLILDDGTTEFWRSVTLADQAATVTGRYVWAAGGTNITSAANTHQMLLPDIVLPSGFRIRTATTNRQATDNFSAPVFYVEEWQ